jgi:hypothetical protein
LRSVSVRLSPLDRVWRKQKRRARVPRRGTRREPRGRRRRTRPARTTRRAQRPPARPKHRRRPLLARRSSTTRRTLIPTLRSVLRDHGSQPTNLSVAGKDAGDADLGGDSDDVTGDNGSATDDTTMVQSSQAASLASTKATSRKWTILPDAPSLSPPLSQSNALQQTATVIPRQVRGVVAPAAAGVPPMAATVSRVLELPRLSVTPASAQTPVGFASAASPAVTAQAPTRIVLGLLGFIGAQPAAVTPVAPFTPIRSFLEIVFAVARR